MLRLSEQFIQNKHFSAHIDEMVTKFWSALWLDAVEEIRMVADFPKLHEHVLVVGVRRGFIDGSLLEQLSVNLLLSLCDADINVHLKLGQ